MRSYVLPLFVLWVLLGDSIGESSKLVKRVFNGFVVERAQKDHYKVLEYYAWIGTTWSCQEDVSAIVRFGFAAGPDGPGPRYACLEKPANQVCGGALIAPRIVQSACHCFAVPLENRPVLDTIYPRVLNTNVRNRYQIYMGFVNTDDMVNPVPSVDVLIHQKCSILGYPPNYTGYDFAWITLKYPVAEGRGVYLGEWGKKLDYAGPYVKNELDLEYIRVLARMHVCMVIGFGHPGFVFGTPPLIERMTHGYIQFADPYECYFWLTTSISIYRSAPSRVHFTRHFDEMNSWVCGKLLKPFFQHGASGDSGGPVSCGGEYFAVISMTMKSAWPILEQTVMDINGAIKFDPEANTVESRARFEAKLLRTPEPAADLPWTNREGLKRLGMGGWQVVRFPHNNRSTIQLVRNSAVHFHGATHFCLISMSLVGRIRQ